MLKTDTIQFRVDHELKNNTADIFHTIGINTTQALTMFLKQVELHQGLPFSVKIPNQDTIQAMEEVNELIENNDPSNSMDFHSWKNSVEENFS